MENYERISHVGEGTYGSVYRCHVKGTAEVVAIKKFKADEGDSQVLKTAMREVGMLRSLRHDNLVCLMDVFRHHGKLCLVFDLVESTVLQLLDRARGGLSERTVKRLVWQLLHALDYLHAHSVMHRDVKPENLLVSQDGVLKLCDFGFACRLDGGGSGSEGGRYTSYVATRWYRAPELLVRSPLRGQYGAEVDIWAVGCVVVEMLTGKPAFPGKTDIEQLQLVHSCCTESGAPSAPFTVTPANRTTVSAKFAHLGAGAVGFLEACLQGDPGKRPSAAQLLTHPWLADSATWLTPQFLEARERDRQALTRRRALLQRQQRLKLTTAQVVRPDLALPCARALEAAPTTTTVAGIYSRPATRTGASKTAAATAAQKDRRSSVVAAGGADAAAAAGRTGVGATAGTRGGMQPPSPYLARPRPPVAYGGWRPPATSHVQRGIRTRDGPRLAQASTQELPPRGVTARSVTARHSAPQGIRPATQHHARPLPAQLQNRIAEVEEGQQPAARASEEQERLPTATRNVGSLDEGHIVSSPRPRNIFSKLMRSSNGGGGGGGGGAGKGGGGARLRWAGLAGEKEERR